MTKTVAATMVCVTALLIGAEATPRTQGQSGVVLMGGGDYLLPPESIEAFWKYADLVVWGRVSARTQKVRHAQSRGASPAPFIEHQFQVLELLKGDDRQRLIQVIQPGGTVVVGGTQYSVLPDRDFPILKVGQEAILFLERPTEDGRPICFGPGGMFLVENQKVKLPSAARISIDDWAKISSISRNDFLKTLRSLRKTISVFD